MNNKNQQNKDITGQNVESEENVQGSILTGEEKELRRMDDWKSHTHEHNRDPKAEYREGELHGVVGKEIHDLLKTEKEQQMHGHQSQQSQQSQHNTNQQTR
jgi:hypothetical protein